MIAWAAEHLGTLVMSLLLTCLIAGAVKIMINDKKKGRSGCGCGCSYCRASDICHSPDGTDLKNRM